MTGVLPSKTTIRLTESTGSFGTIPAADARAAGCMTAEHVQRLETLWAIHQTNGGTGGTTMVIERPGSVDTSQFVRQDQLRAVLRALPMPDVAPLHQQVSDLSQRLAALPSPTSSDDGPLMAASLMTERIADLEARIAYVETVIAVLKNLSAIKSHLPDEAS